MYCCVCFAFVLLDVMQMRVNPQLIFPRINKVKKLNKKISCDI